MKTFSYLLRACFALAALMILSQHAVLAAADTPVPPRIGMVNGEASFWRPGAKDWTPAQVNMPLSSGDALYTAEGATVEIQIGARAYIRLAQHAMLSLLENEPRIARFKLASGTAAFDLRSLPAGRNVEVDTPAAAFDIASGGYYRIEIADGATHFIVRRGGDATVTLADGTSRRIAPSQEAVVEDGGGVETYVAPDTDAWDDWNYARTDSLIDAITNRYVSPEVYGTDDLDHYGKWRVTPEYGAVWLPSDVGPGWAPYSTGSWVWDPFYAWTWVDTAPWGWAPYHYGRWVHIGGYWAWAPGPRIVYPAYAPALVVFFQSGGGAIVTSFGGPAVSWVALSWGEPCFPWWGRSGFVGRPWWGGWGGPRIVNNVVVQHNTTIVNNIRNIKFRNAGQRDAVIAMPVKRFGQGRVAEAQRVESVQARELKPVVGRHPVQPSPVSLAPNVAKAVMPAREIIERPAVTTRSVARPMAPRKQEQREAPKAGEPTAKSQASQFPPWAPFGKMAGPERSQPRPPPEPPRVEKWTPPSAPVVRSQAREGQRPQQRIAPEISQDTPGPQETVREPPRPPVQRQSTPAIRTPRQIEIERPQAMTPPQAPRAPAMPVLPSTTTPRAPHPPAPPHEAQSAARVPPVIAVPRLEGQLPTAPRQAPVERPEPPGLMMQQTPRLPGQPANQLHPRRIQKENEQER